MPHVSVNGVELYYESYGEGPAIILAHGVGGNHASWYHQIPVFSKSYQTIVIDHRGFGLSTDPERKGRAEFVEDLKGLVDHLKLDKVTLVAQSMGGGTCAAFTCKYPERVSALVLADTLAAYAEDGALKTRMDEVRAATNGLSQVERVLGPKIRREHPELALLYTQVASFNSYNIRTIVGKPTPWSAKELTDTKVPVMFIYGVDDILFPPDAIRMVQAEVKGSFLVEISDAGHSAYFESPVEFNDSVLSFLNSVGVKGLRRAALSNAPGYKAVS